MPCLEISVPPSQAVYYGVTKYHQRSNWNQFELLNNLKTFQNSWINIGLFFFLISFLLRTNLRADTIHLFFWLDILFFSLTSSLYLPPVLIYITQPTYSSWFICSVLWSSFQTFRINYSFIWRNHNWLFGWETQFTKVAQERHSSFCSIIKSMFK